MKIFLTSMGFVGVRDENGNKTDCNLNPKNNFIKNLFNSIKKFDSFVFVCNDFTTYEENDNSAKLNFDALKKENFNFKTLTVLDSRTKNNTQEIIKNADLLYFQGGKIICQSENFAACNLKEHLKNFSGVIVGQSAGSMNCAQTVYNYPEEEFEINDAKFVNGLGLTNINIIPHFNLETGNEFNFANFDLFNNYFYPDSHIVPLYALIDGSYILIDGNTNTIFGESYLIKNGKLTKLCSDNQNIFID